MLIKNYDDTILLLFEEFYDNFYFKFIFVRSTVKFTYLSNGFYFSSSKQNLSFLYLDFELLVRNLR